MLLCSAVTFVSQRHLAHKQKPSYKGVWEIDCLAFCYLQYRRAGGRGFERVLNMPFSRNSSTYRLLETELPEKNSY